MLARSMALVLVLALAACSSRSAPGPAVAPPAFTVAPAAAPARGLPLPPPVKGVATPLGTRPAPVAEPAPIDRSTPGAVLASFEGALARRDLATIARVRVGPLEKPVLDSHDLDRVNLDVFSHGLDAYWRRVLAAADRTALAGLAAAGGARIVLPVDLSGALGSVSLVFQSTVDGWVLR